MLSPSEVVSFKPKFPCSFYVPSPVSFFFFRASSNRPDDYLHVFVSLNVGIGAAMTVPSALSLIVEWFPEPSEQNQAISFFGGSSALGNGASSFSFVFCPLVCALGGLGLACILIPDDLSLIYLFFWELSTVFGIILGGIFVQWASWRWILWFTGIVGLGIAIVSLVSVPISAPRKHKPSWRRLDLGAVSFITGTFPSPPSSKKNFALIFYIIQLHSSFSSTPSHLVRKDGEKQTSLLRLSFRLSWPRFSSFTKPISIPKWQRFLLVYGSILTYRSSLPSVSCPSSGGVNASTLSLCPMSMN